MGAASWLRALPERFVCVRFGGCHVAQRTEVVLNASLIAPLASKPQPGFLVLRKGTIFMEDPIVRLILYSFDFISFYGARIKRIGRGMNASLASRTALSVFRSF